MYAVNLGLGFEDYRLPAYIQATASSKGMFSDIHISSISKITTVLISSCI